MLEEIREIGYREFSLREYERRQEGQTGAQRNIVAEYLKKATRAGPSVLAGLTAVLTDYLNAALQGAPNDVEVYDDLEAYRQDKTLLHVIDTSHPQ
jgi:hypothetical protein